MSSRFRFVPVLCIALALAACGGGGATIRASGQSCGQELTDLKSAFEAGAVSEREYQRLREAAIRRCQQTR